MSEREMLRMVGRRDSNPPIHMLRYACLSQAIENKQRSMAAIAAYVGVFLWDGSKWQRGVARKSRSELSQNTSCGCRRRPDAAAGR
jgi:hypothetical protein